MDASSPPSEIIWLAILLPVSLVLLAHLLRTGRLSRTALADAPRRTPRLNLGHVLVGVVLMLAGGQFAGFALAELSPALEPLDVTLSAAVQTLLAQAISQLPVAVLAILGARGLVRIGLSFHRFRSHLKPAALALLLALPLVITANLAMSLVAWLVGYRIPDFGHELLEVVQASTELPGLLLLLFSVIVVAPVLEELIFRGLLQTALLNTIGRRFRWTAIFLTAGLFAVIHLGAVPWIVLPGLATLAIILGYLYEKTGSLWPGILLHAGFNAVMATLTLIVPTPNQPPEPAALMLLTFVGSS